MMAAGRVLIGPTQHSYHPLQQNQNLLGAPMEVGPNQTRMSEANFGVRRKTAYDARMPNIS